MATTVLVAASNQTIGYQLRAQVEELDGFTIVDVADSTSRLVELVVRHDPQIVLAHDQIGPVPVLQAIRDVVARRPGTAVVLLGEELSADVLTEAMDAGARSVLAYPVSHEELQTRLPVAADWAKQMRSHLQSGGGDGELGTRGRLVAVAGAKGGVGTTTVATHLAHHAVTNVAGRSVCLVDLDLDGGDLADFLGITHRLDVSDLAKVADDLSVQTLGSAIHRSTSGLSTILGPTRIEDVGEVGEREVMLILAALRRQFDLIVVDCGSSVTPASAAAVESADEVLLVSTPDLLALRGCHRTMERWNRVGARDLAGVKILLTMVNRDNDIQPETATRLLPKAPIEETLPRAYKILQRGLNSQDPSEVRAKSWWSAIDAVAREVGTVTTRGRESPPRSTGRSLFRGRSPEPADERGQASVEFAGLIGLVLLLMVLLWQVALWGVTAAYTSHAADEAAREAGLGSSPQQVRAVALDSVPGMFRDQMSVDTSSSTVRVRGGLPILVPSFTLDDVEFTSKTPIIHED